MNSEICEDVLSTLKSMDAEVQESGRELAQSHEIAFLLAKPWFAHIEQIEFIKRGNTATWQAFVFNSEMKEAVFERTNERLKSFLQSPFLTEGIRLYGGIKSLSSLMEKIVRAKIQRSVEADPLVFWDIVRFRIVCPSLGELAMVGKSFWDYFSADTVRCRNFYTRPQHGILQLPYRAIHFELADEDERLVEVQLMSKYREAVALIEHSTLFKRKISCLDEQHEKLLFELSQKANIAEVRQVRREAW